MSQRVRGDVFETALDLVAVIAVAGFLVGVHLLVPHGLREEFALRYADPDPFRALSATYVHLDHAHLVGNVSGYLATCGMAYALAWLAGERRWFRLSFLAYLSVLPITVGLITATIVGGEFTGRGFSIVVAGFTGFVLVSPAVLLQRGFGYQRWVGWNAVAGMAIAVGAEITWIIRETVSFEIVALFALGLVITLGVIVVEAIGGLTQRRARSDWFRLATALATMLLILAALTVFVVGLFPSELGSQDHITNILGHYLGLVGGTVIAGCGARYWATEERRNEPR